MERGNRMKNKKAVCMVVLLIFLLTIGIVSQTAFALYNTTNPWLTYRHDLSRTGYSTTTAPSTNTSLFWAWAQYYSASPIVADGRVIVKASGGMYGLDETTGVKLWGPVQFTGTFSQPASYEDGKVYAGTSSGYVYCLNASTGAKIWEYQTAASVTTATAVANGKVYFGTSDNYMYALNATTGAFVWRYTAPDDVNSSPAVVGTWIYFGCNDGSLFALNDTGTLPAKKWQVTTGGRIYSTPVVANGMVFFGSSSSEHMLYAVDQTTGQLIWGYVITGGYNIDNPVAFYDGYVFLTVTNYKAYCLNSAATPGFNYSETDPSIRVWSQTLASSPQPPIVADGKVFVGASNTLYVLDATTGQFTWTYTAGNQVYEPVVADERLFVPTYNSLLCFGNPFPPVSYDFNIDILAQSFSVNVMINATILGDMDIGGLLTLKKINFTVQGISGMTCMTNVTIPNALLGGPYTVTVDGGLPNDPPGVIVTSNDTHSFIYFTYGLSTHGIEITGTTVVPEYTSITLLAPLMLAAVLVAFKAVFAKRNRKTMSQKL
jgi:outer membrane protein assembly factor BamB